VHNIDITRRACGDHSSTEVCGKLNRVSADAACRSMYQHVLAWLELSMIDERLPGR
jgi:hypothetical protein